MTKDAEPTARMAWVNAADELPRETGWPICQVDHQCLKRSSSRMHAGLRVLSTSAPPGLRSVSRHAKTPTPTWQYAKMSSFYWWTDWNPADHKRCPHSPVVPNRFQTPSTRTKPGFTNTVKTWIKLDLKLSLGLTTQVATPSIKLDWTVLNLD